MKNRSPIAVALLALITLGIYTLFWLRDTRKELVAAGQKVWPVKVLLIPLLALLFIPLLQFIIRFTVNSAPTVTDTLPTASSGATVLNIISLLVGTVAVFLVIPLTIYWYYLYCKAADKATNGQVSMTMSLVLLVVLGFFALYFVWPGIIQNEYNKVNALVPDTSPPDRFSPVA